MRMREIARARIRYGYRKIRVLLNREGWNVGKKLVYRLYREEGLGLRRRPKGRRIASAHRRQKPRAEAPNRVWSLDFVADQVSDSRRFRALTVVDVFTRECLAIEVGQSLKGHDVVRVLQQIAGERGAPQVLFRRQRQRVHQPGAGPAGVSPPGEDRLLTSGHTDRQRLCGELQRNVAGRVLGCTLVLYPGRSAGTDRGLEA
jgi:transposase InsO family protein